VVDFSFQREEGEGRTSRSERRRRGIQQARKNRNRWRRLKKRDFEEIEKQED
jgi:hypothetical protein